MNKFEVVPLNCLWLEPGKLIEIIKLMREQEGDRCWTYSNQSLDLEKIYFPAPPKGGAHLPKFAVWQPGNVSCRSVLVPNYGDEMIQLMRHLNRRFHIRYFSTHLSRDHKKEGICRFEHADETGARRVVHVILDRRWKFYDQGVILPFEDPSYYQRQRIAERLTLAIVMGYLKSLGWNLEDEVFWKSRDDAWIAEKTKFE